MANAKKVPIDLDDVQIRQPASAVYAKIEDFMKRKRDESNDRNTRLYCSPVSENGHRDSARTCVTVAAKRRKGSECYVKKTVAENAMGPLTNGGYDPASKNSYKMSLGLTFDGPRPDVQERIANLEQCLNLPDDSHEKTDLHGKLKFIEDRVLKMESVVLKMKVGSLTDLRSIDLQTGLTHDETIEKKVICEICKHDVKSRNINFTVPQAMKKTKKYTADDIQSFINDLNKNEAI